MKLFTQCANCWESTQLPNIACNVSQLDFVRYLYFVSYNFDFTKAMLLNKSISVFFCRNCVFAIKVNTGWIHESYNNCFLYLFYNTCASINLIVLYSNLIDIQLHCTVVWQNNAVQNLFFVLPNFIFRLVFMRHSNVTPRRDLGSVIQVRIKNANF